MTVVIIASFAARVPYLASKMSGMVTLPKERMRFAMKNTSTIASQAPPEDQSPAGPLRYPSPAPPNREPLPIQVASRVPTRMNQGSVRPATMKSSLPLTDRVL